MIRLLATAHFDSPWYWVLHVVVWSVVCARTLGVPTDMLVRARRDGDAAARVDLLAGIAAERVAGVSDRAGPAIAAAAGFVIAGLAGIGFGSGIEAAQAVLFLLAPLAAIGYSNVRLSLYLRQSRLVGPHLVLALGWRRICHQTIAVVAMLAAIATAVLLHGRAV
ncbi:MAG: hypothetical protein QM699_14135 [Amaricoccus sp.]|uniref:hypothetical protein n=1 Tax=Amaricoccus sp. TaxID=1872485 RepID=UPI0039E693DE